MEETWLTIRGTVTASPELRFTSSGLAVASFTVASNERKYDRDAGRYVDGDALFMRVSAWRMLAENCAESLSKGTRVVVFGKLAQRSFDDRDGVKRTVIELTAEDVSLSLKFNTATAHRTERQSSSRPASQPASDDPWAVSDDLPPF